jgi:hypothetical protein
MPLRRRRRLPPDLVDRFVAFREVLTLVERASSALSDTVPSTRRPGRPLAYALHEAGGSLEEAAALMHTWFDPRVRKEWRACDEAMGNALELSDRIRLAAPDPEGFGEIVAWVGNLIAPLEEAFLAAHERFLDLRTSAG